MLLSQLYSIMDYTNYLPAKWKCLAPGDKASFILNTQNSEDWKITLTKGKQAFVFKFKRAFRMDAVQSIRDPDWKPLYEFFYDKAVEDGFGDEKCQEILSEAVARACGLALPSNAEFSAKCVVVLLIEFMTLMRTHRIMNVDDATYFSAMDVVDPPFTSSPVKEFPVKRFVIQRPGTSLVLCSVDAKGAESKEVVRFIREEEKDLQLETPLSENEVGLLLHHIYLNIMTLQASQNLLQQADSATKQEFCKQQSEWLQMFDACEKHFQGFPVRLGNTINIVRQKLEKWLQIQEYEKLIEEYSNKKRKLEATL